MPKPTLVIFDPNITENSPAGSCLLKMLRSAAAQYRLEVFTSRTDLRASEEVTLHKMPVPFKPVFLQSILFTLESLLFYFFLRPKGLRIGTQGGFPLCDVSYAHCCHKLFLTRYREYIGGGFFTRSARLLNYQWSAAMEARAFQHARWIVVPSEGLKKELIDAYGPAIEAKIRLISNPVDCERFRGKSALPRPFTFSFCALGNFEWKGLPLVLEALKTVPAQLQVIGGSAADVEHYRKLAPGVDFVGMQSDIRPFLWASDAFVFPSVYETFPLVCLQAAASGLPLIATNLYGLEQLLQPGVSGWRVERNVGAIAAAMKEAAENPQRTLEMGREAQKLAQSYAEPVFQRRWLELLREIAV